MNTKTLLTAAALAAASVPAFATSTLTRAEVRAEMDGLRAAQALPVVNEASPSQLDANRVDARIAKLQAADTAAIEPESLMFVTPTGMIVIIETLPGGEGQAAQDARRRY